MEQKTAARLNKLLTSKYYLTDSGLETTLIYKKNRKLRHFAAFELVAEPNENQRIYGTHSQDMLLLSEYFEEHLEIAVKHNMGLCIETPTWRCSSAWGFKLGYSEKQLRRVNESAVKLFQDLRAKAVSEKGINSSDVIISGCIGPKGDGYTIDDVLTVEAYEKYHMQQCCDFKRAGVDLISALTMTHKEEAIGIAKAAKKLQVDCVISFTVEIDGRLPSGLSLSSAVEAVEIATNGHPAYYMLNCAHPTHFRGLFAEPEKGKSHWYTRIKGLRVNASSKSHEELDNCSYLDDGDPKALGIELRDICSLHKEFRVIGGCCGTDIRHIESIAQNLEKR